jgi:Spy/CpxP family protein refolding chaperone
MRQHQRGPSVERKLKQLTQLLTLTAEQQAQVKTILTDEHQQIEAVFRPTKAASEDQPPSPETREAARTAIRALRADTQSKIAAVLTADQKASYAACLVQPRSTTIFAICSRL